MKVNRLVIKFRFFFFQPACSFRSTRRATARLNEANCAAFVFIRCFVKLNQISVVSIANKR